jgi:hypothetical protein
MLTPAEGHVLSRVLAWGKKTFALAKQIATLEARVAALEESLGKQPADACPFCGERAMRKTRAGPLMGAIKVNSGGKMSGPVRNAAKPKRDTTSSRRRKVTPDNPEQFKRFIDMPREVEVDESPDAIDRAFNTVIRPRNQKVKKGQ